MSLAEQLPGSKPARWDFAMAKATPPSPCMTPSPGADSPTRNSSSGSSSSPRGTKVRRPDSESHCFRGTSLLLPDAMLQDDDDLGNVPVGSRIKPPDPTPAGEWEDGTSGVSTQELRRASSAPLGRTKR